MRTGYSAIADEWVPITPGTDGAFLLAIIHELIATGLYDREFLVRYTNAGQLVNVDAGSARFGLLASDAAQSRSQRDVSAEQAVVGPARPIAPVATHTPGADPCLFGDYALPDGTPVKPAFRCSTSGCATTRPSGRREITGIPADTIRRLAHEMGVTARDQKIELPIPWTDSWGEEHDTVTGNPVAFHAMRGLAAHSNGFQTMRALAILMSLLGTIDRPGGFRHKSPFPRAIPPSAKPPNHPGRGASRIRRSAGLALGWPASPDDLFIDDDGNPVRIDKGFSWEYPLSVHGLMHNVITNAWRGDPYRIDTLHDLHGQHGVELDDEHGRGAQDAERPRRRPASTRSRSSSCATRSSRRRPRSPTSSCPIRLISSATT